MKKKYLKEEEKTIIDKKVKIKTLPNPLTASAKGKNLIEVSENIKEVLGEEGYNQILFHERGHLRFINNLLLSLPSVIFVLSILYISLRILDFSNFSKVIIFYLWFIPILFILEILCFWFIEILADRFAIKKANLKTYEKTLNKVYNYPGYSGNSSWIYRNIKHPPKKLRFYFIKKFIGKL
jgi:Zn-dependent protease with chaperone function